MRKLMWLGAILLGIAAVNAMIDYQQGLRLHARVLVQAAGAQPLSLGVARPLPRHAARVEAENRVVLSEPFGLLLTRSGLLPS
jgi:hypothetical protein